MKVLLTNDDGIGAEGLHALRRALGELDGIETNVIVPDSNRSATARSITTRPPLSVEEVELDDGAIAYATDGTPVDCVRFGDLGLVGERPDLIVSGINHGSNLGDDITYSGTVAAALEGIVLGIPAIAISQQGSAQEMGFVPGRTFDFAVAAQFGAALVRRLAQSPLPAETLLNVNCRPGSASGCTTTSCGWWARTATAGAATRSTASSPRSRTSRGPTSPRSRGSESRSRRFTSTSPIAPS
jgi:5'-nucleotidase